MSETNLVIRWIHNLLRFGRDRAGNAGAEFALTLPLLMVITFGIVEMGRMLHDLHVVKESVRDGARYLSRMPVTCNGGAGTFNNANDEVAGKALAMTGSTPAGSNLLGYWDFNSQQNTITVTVTCLANGGAFEGIYSGAAAVPVITMQADVPFTLLFGQLISTSPTLTFDVQHTVANVNTTGIGAAPPGGGP